MDKSEENKINVYFEYNLAKENGLRLIKRLIKEKMKKPPRLNLATLI